MPAKKKSVNINLIIKDQFGTSYYEQLLSWTLTYGRYIVIIVQIVVLSVFFMRFKLDRDHTDLKEAITQKQAIVESIAGLETEVRRVQNKLSDIAQIAKKQKTIPNILYFLQDNMPASTTLSNLSASSIKISFVATSKDLYEFSFLLNRLQQDKKFTEVSLEDVKRRIDGRIEFRINTNINTDAFTQNN